MTKKYALVLATAIMLGACSSDPQQVHIPDSSPQKIYQDAKHSLEKGNVSTAISQLETLMSRYPFGPHADQVQLDLIFAYYRAGEADKALASIDRFVRLNPTHPDIDYALYMRGLTQLDMDSDWFHELFNVDRADRDPANVRGAFIDFSRMLQQYPESSYAPDARLRMISIKQRLARHEIAVAKYYIKRDAWVAAANRGKYVLEQFGDTPATEKALEIMIRSYDELGLPELRDDAISVLQLNYPDNRIGKQARLN